jgi:hypothetical protein
VTAGRDPRVTTGRRTSRLLASLIGLVLGATFAAGGYIGSAIGIFLVSLYLLTSGAALCAYKLEISSERITETRPSGGVRSIRRDEATACKYIRYRGAGRDANMYFVEISDTRGNRIKVSRYGWGRKKRPIFLALRTWLRQSSAVVSPEAEDMISRALRGG